MNNNNTNNNIGTVLQCYRTTPLHIFRQKLRSSCIQSLLASTRRSLASDNTHNDNNCNHGNINDNDNGIFGGSSCSSNDNISNNMGMNEIRYNRQRFESELSKLDWKTLCEQHDDLAYSTANTASSPSSIVTTTRRKRKRDEQKEKDHHLLHEQQRQVDSVVVTPSSSLIEIVDTICDPIVVPLCCQANVVVRILLKAIQQSPRARSSATRNRSGRTYSKTASSAKTMFASSCGNDSISSNTSGRSSSTSTATIGGGRWSPSQDLLIRRLQITLVHQPSASITFMRYFETDTCDFTSMSPNNANRLVSVIFCLLNNFTYHDDISRRKIRIVDDAAELTKLDLVSASLALLRRMDAMAIVQQKQRHHRRNISSHTSRQQTPTILNQRVFGRNLYEMKKRSCRKSAKMTLSDLLDESIETSLPYNSSSIDGGGDVRGRDSEKSSNEWLTVRSRLYKKLIRYIIDEKQRKSLPTKANGSDVMVNVSSFFVSDTSILREAVCRPQSPSLRICLLFLAQSSDPGSPHHRHYRYCKISDLCWQGYIASTTRTTTKTTGVTEATFQHFSTASVWLRIYAEWIGDCSFFAENKKSCWDCLHPLVQFLQKISQNIDDGNDRNESNGDSDDTCEVAIKRNETISQLLASIGYVLSRRSRMLQNRKKDRVQVEFEKFVQYLSIHFGEDEGLFLKLISDEEKKGLIRSTLQRLGIFGLSMTNKPSKNDSTEKTEDSTNTDSSNFKFTTYSEALKCWPFANQYSIRSAVQRIDGKVLATIDGLGNVQRLLSSAVEQADALNCEGTSREEKKNQQPKSCVPILDSLQHKNDIFSHIFSFCGHKKLLMIEQTCKSWRATIRKDSNILWRGAYLGQYRAIHEGVDLRCPAPCKEKKLASPSSSDNQSSRPDSTAPDALNWKSLFERKYMAQKCLWNKRSSKTGFKYRTCPYIGCYCVMKSIDQERKHILVHERSDKKALDARNKKKTTKVKRATATKAKNNAARKKSSSAKSGNQTTKKS